MKNFFMTLSFAVIVFAMPVLVYTVNRQQDLRQQASINNNMPTTQPEIPGCPASNTDGTPNVCRAQVSCNIGEIEKEDGANECTQKLQLNAICCNKR